jgi:D-alanine--poly(phosphoribitol) ligase subunit 2
MMMMTMTGVQQQVTELFARNLHVQVPSVEADLLGAGLLDSLGVVELLVLLEERFGVAIVPDELEFDHFRSVASIAAFVNRRRALAA